MRTLICEGTEAIIFEESRSLLLGLEVFSLWESTSSLSERGEQGFSLQRRSTFNVRDSQNHPCAWISILGFQGILGNERQRPLIKGPYCVLQRWAFNKRWITSISAHQFQSGRPITAGPSGLYFILFIFLSLTLFFSFTNNHSPHQQFVKILQKSLYLQHYSVIFREKMFLNLIVKSDDYI